MVADFLKGLIKLAAAGVKSLEEKPTGVTRHTDRAMELLSAVMASEPKFCGLDLEHVLAQSRTELYGGIWLKLGEG